MIWFACKRSLKWEKKLRNRRNHKKVDDHKELEPITRKSWKHNHHFNFAEWSSLYQCLVLFSLRLTECQTFFHSTKNGCNALRCLALVQYENMAWIYILFWKPPCAVKLVEQRPAKYDYSRSFLKVIRKKSRDNLKKDVFISLRNNCSTKCRPPVHMEPCQWFPFRAGTPGW